MSANNTVLVNMDIAPLDGVDYSGPRFLDSGLRC